MQPPAQEIVAKDLHDTTWTFRHIYRGIVTFTYFNFPSNFLIYYYWFYKIARTFVIGQPKRHLLTTGWSVFVSTKRLFAGDSVLFIR
jgi:hypothetical protein